MSLASLRADITRTKVGYLRLKMPYCSNEFGVSPCTATGTKCYKTLTTCKDKANYANTTRNYDFVDIDLSLSAIAAYLPARPYLIKASDVPCEIKDSNTVVRRVTFELADEDDNDVGVDEYFRDRSTIQGTYWKKWISRNLNYKRGVVEYYEGFVGLAFADFQLKFTGKVDKVTRSNGSVKFECVDLLRAMSDIKYPLRQDISLTTTLANMYIAQSEDAMLTLNAVQNDLCRRQDWRYNVTFNDPGSSTGGGSLPAGLYDIFVFAYDVADRPFAFNILSLEFNLVIGNAITIDWSTSGLTGASYYRVYYKLRADANLTKYYIVDHPEHTFTITGSGYSSEIAPVYAEWYCKLTGTNPSTLTDWTEYTDDVTCALSDASPLDASGYIKIDKEIIYYPSKTGNTLNHIQRMQFDTDGKSHSANSVVYALLKKAAGNGFTHLKSILDLAGIDSAYIDTKFDTYETAGMDINFSTPVIAKDTNLAEIYFDLVNSLDCMSWQNEAGKITILKYSETPASMPVISDKANIILGSTSVDINEASRRTRWALFWNRIDVEAGLKEKEAYDHLTLLVDTAAETEYDDEQIDEQYTTWINTDCGTAVAITDYIAALLASRRLRTMRVQPILICSLEMKDDTIETGAIVQVTTDELQDIAGNNYADEQFRVISKTKSNNQLKLKLKKKSSYKLMTEEGDYILTEDGQYIEVEL